MRKLVRLRTKNISMHTKSCDADSRTYFPYFFTIQQLITRQDKTTWALQNLERSFLLNSIKGNVHNSETEGYCAIFVYMTTPQKYFVEKVGLAQFANSTFFIF